MSPMHATIALLAALLPTLPVSGQVDFGRSRTPGRGEDLVKVKVLTDAPRIGPGQTFHVAVVLDIEPHWHVYWRNSGDSGAPTEVEVKGPEGFEIGATLYPRPRSFREPDGTTFGYEKQTVLFVPVTAPKTLSDGGAAFDVDVFFLVCRDVCLMGSVQQRAEIATSAERVTTTIEPPPPLEKFRGRLPRALADEKDHARVEFRRDGILVVAGPARGETDVALIPDYVGGVVFGTVVKAEVRDDRFLLEVPLRLEPQNASGPMEARGVIVLGKGDDAPCYDFALALNAASGTRPDGVGP